MQTRGQGNNTWCSTTYKKNSIQLLILHELISVNHCSSMNQVMTFVLMSATTNLGLIGLDNHIGIDISHITICENPRPTFLKFVSQTSTKGLLLGNRTNVPQRSLMKAPLGFKCLWPIELSVVGIDLIICLYSSTQNKSPIMSATKLSYCSFAQLALSVQWWSPKLLLHELPALSEPQL